MFFNKNKMEDGPVTIEISGMHCSSCKTLIEDILSEENIDILNFYDNFLELKNGSDFEKVKRLLAIDNYKVSRKK